MYNMYEMKQESELSSKNMDLNLDQIQTSKTPCPQQYKGNKENINDKLLYSPNGLLNFYKDPINRNIFISIIKQKTVISLRLLDWLITNYSKKFNVNYNLQTGNPISGTEYINQEKNFNLWINYKDQLSAYYKKNFDPFSRRQRIFFNIEKLTVEPVYENYQEYNDRTNGVLTTVGQMNFFRWAIMNKVIDYAFDNIKEIENNMLESLDKKNKTDKSRKKLSKNNSIAKAQKFKVIVRFDN